MLRQSDCNGFARLHVKAFLLRKFKMLLNFTFIVLVLHVTWVTMVNQFVIDVLKDTKEFAAKGENVKD